MAVEKVSYETIRFVKKHIQTQVLFLFQSFGNAIKFNQMATTMLTVHTSNVFNDAQTNPLGASLLNIKVTVGVIVKCKLPFM